MCFLLFIEKIFPNYDRSHAYHTTEIPTEAANFPSSLRTTQETRDEQNPHDPLPDKAVDKRGGSLFSQPPFWPTLETAPHSLYEPLLPNSLGVASQHPAHQN
jgi:hypothetical protein